MGHLEANIIVFKLPCWKVCPFGRLCADKYRDRECKPRIDDFVEENVYGTPGEINLSAGVIKFETTDPNGKVTIEEGFVNIKR